MPFNSFQYFLFLPAVWLVYFLAGERARWCVLLLASLLFYTALKVPYLLPVLLLVALSTFCFGNWLGRAGSALRKQYLLFGGISVNLLVLIIMKYLPFLSGNLAALSALLGFDGGVRTLKILIAVGVSYYVFQAISYLIDIYLEIEEPEGNFGYFLLYLVFFPKLLQGPIERAGDLLPQLRKLSLPEFGLFRAGLFLIASGLFRKIVIADRLALFVNPVFDSVESYSGSVLLAAAYLYALQIYFDFSGYTEIALGTARLFNVKLTNNFNSPYLATSIADFWRRWHISFSRWILDYLFKPLQMQWRNSKNAGTASALIVTFLVSGVWHGADWGFVIWGLLHGCYLAASIYYRPYQKKIHKLLRVDKTSPLKVWQVLVTFNLVSFAWIFFRAGTLHDAWYVVTHLTIGIADITGLQRYLQTVAQSGATLRELSIAFISIGLLTAVSSLAKREHLQAAFFGSPVWLRTIIYYGIAMYMIVYACLSNQSFAYIRF